jgi:ribosomal RNA-processing protein 12
VLYQKVDLRTTICQALQRLVDSNKDRLGLEEDDSLELLRVSREMAESNLKHLQQFASNLLAVLFNVYTETLPDYRAPILQCINSYLGIMIEQDIVDTFDRVATMLEGSLVETNGSSKKQAKANGQSNKSQMPPLSHTLMDLVITITSYLPRASLAPLFNIAILMLSKDDASLQKKAYKIIPRLADSETGKEALHERKDEMQQLLVNSSENVQPAARHDRLLSISKLIESLKDSELHFIPTILPEVVICTREHNEKARTAAYELLVRMGELMAQGGTIQNSKVPHMAEDAPSTSQASLDEYFTMVSAGLAGTAPHAISACISALARILYEFKDKVAVDTVDELVETMDVFLKSQSREILGSVLGFVKVSVISLPSERLEKRLPTLVPNLLDWSGEHKAHVQAKVKHIFERLVRKFGADKIERYTPEKDRKLIVNIRKLRERRKKSKQQAQEGDGAATTSTKRFDMNALDEALYASDDESFRAASSSGSDVSDDEMLGRSGAQRKKRKGQGLSFIVEDETEPLDLLDSRSLARISSTKPLAKKPGQGIKSWRARSKMDADGKLIFGDEEAAETNGHEAQDDTGGINAYVAAMTGADAPRRGAKGRIKFSNRPRANNDEDENEEDGDVMEVDEQEVAQNFKDKQRQKQKQLPRHRGSFNGRGAPSSPGGIKKHGSQPSRPRAGGFKGQKMQRRGLGAEKARGGRVFRAGGRGGGVGRSRR